MIVDTSKWFGTKVTHYMSGFLEEPTEQGIIVGINLAVDGKDFILTLKTNEEFTRAKASMCLIGWYE